MPNMRFLKGSENRLRRRQEGNLSGGSEDHSGGECAIDNGKELRSRFLSVDFEWSEQVGEIGEQFAFVLNHAAMEGMSSVRVFRCDEQEGTTADLGPVHEPVDLD